MGLEAVPGRDAAGGVAAPDGGPRGCRKVRKNLDTTASLDNSQLDGDLPICHFLDVNNILTLNV